jgi:transcriptional regulator with XRE-family HTH domain
VSKAIGADKKRRSTTLAQAIGAELTESRRVGKMSQQALADRLGYDVSHVRKTEMGGNPTLEFLNALATFFSLKLSEFIDKAEKRMTNSQ